MSVRRGVVRGSTHDVVVEVAELSDPGRDPTKQVNEDSVAHATTAHGHLVIVCDGMGGHTGGREASRAAVRTILAEVEAAPPGAPPGPLLRAAVEAAGRAVWSIGGAEPEELRPGSTCVAALIHDGVAELAHVGDSRIYLVRDGLIEQLTRDHSMVQEMVDAGLISREEAAVHPDANQITRALGMHPEVDVELRSAPLPLRAGDVLLLASDGLSDLVGDDEIARIVTERAAARPETVCAALVALANERGGWDNVTVQLARVVQLSTRDDARTLLDEPPRTVRVGERPPPTVLEAHPATATLLDEPRPERLTEPGEPRLERVTEPGDQPPPLAPTLPPGATPTSRQAGRWLVAGAGAVAFAIVVAIGAWWASGSFRHAPEPSSSSRAPTAAPPAPSARPETVLEPIPGALEEEPSAHPHHHHRHPDGGLARDASGGDVTPDAAPTGP